MMQTLLEMGIVTEVDYGEVDYGQVPQTGCGSVQLVASVAKSEGSLSN